MEFSRRTTAILTGFFIAGVAATGIYLAMPESANNEPVSFADDNGENVTVTPNEDGTETAQYADGRSVTFQRGDDGSLSYVGGTAALLGGLAAGYLLSRGFTGGSGYYDSASNTYRATTPYTYNRSLDKRGTGLAPNGISKSRADGGTTAETQNNASKPATSNGASVKSPNTAGGFGGAGARSAAS